jgi:hypothetical protein
MGSEALHVPFGASDRDRFSPPKPFYRYLALPYLADNHAPDHRAEGISIYSAFYSKS